MKNTILFIAIMTFVIFQSCTNPLGVKPPTSEQIAVGHENAQLEKKKLETELCIIKDLDEGITQATKEDKPILLIFTGHAVVNARKLESEVIIGNKKVFSLMKNNFINVWLYVDDRKDRDKARKWSKLQSHDFYGNHQPQIFVLDSKGHNLDRDISYPQAKEELLPMLLKYSGQ